jgi:hypothetical protein
MTVLETLEADEVVLDSIRYPLSARPTVQNVTPFPEKLTFGDFTRANDPLASAWVLTDWTGGFLKRRLKADVDIDRFWDSTLDTRDTTELKLAPLANNITGWTGYPQNGTGGTPRRVYPTGAVEFVDTNSLTRPTRLLVAFWDPTVQQATLRKLDIAHQRWVRPDQTPVPPTFTGDPAYLTTTATETLLSQPIDRPAVALMDNRIWWVFPSHAGILWYGDTWEFQAGNSSTGNPCPNADRVVCWDQKLFGLEADTCGFWMITSISAHLASAGGSASAWERRATLPVRAYDCTHLEVFRNAASEPVIHAVCKDSLWAYDYAADTWVGPIVKFPRQIRSGEGLVDRQQTLHIGGGTSIFQYDTNVFRDVGFGKDWGLPAYRSGPVYRLADAVNWLAVGTDTAVPTRQVQASVLLRSDVGYHHFWLAPTANTTLSWLHHSYADDRARLYWGESGSVQNAVYYADMPLGVFNPHDSETSEYATSGALTTGWFDGNWQEQLKCGVSLYYRAEDCTGTETIAVEYALDDDETEGAWVTVMTLVEPGTGAVPLGDFAHGLPFRTIRFRIRMARGTTTGATPVLRALVLKFARRPSPTYAYTLSVVVPPDGYNGKTAIEMEAALEAVLTSETLSTLAFRRADRPIGTAPTTRVLNTHWSYQATEEGGRGQLAFVAFGA